MVVGTGMNTNAHTVIGNADWQAASILTFLATSYQNISCFTEEACGRYRPVQQRGSSYRSDGVTHALGEPCRPIVTRTCTSIVPVQVPYQPAEFILTENIAESSHINLHLYPITIGIWRLTLLQHGKNHAQRPARCFRHDRTWGMTRLKDHL